MLEGEQRGRPKRSVWLNLWLTCGTGEIDEVPLSFILCGERGYRNRTLQCGGPGLGARSHRGVPRLINGTGGPSKTALPADRARRLSKNNQSAEAAPASCPNRLQLLKEPDFNAAWGEITKTSSANSTQEAVIWLVRNSTFNDFSSLWEVTNTDNRYCINYGITLPADVIISKTRKIFNLKKYI